MKTLKSFYILIYLFLFFSGSFAQGLKGIVKDIKDNSLLPFVSIEILETKKGYTTNLNGEFFIDSVNIVQKMTLRFMLIGYITEERIITKKDSLIIVHLTPKEYLLQAVTIYSDKQSKENLNQISNLTLQSDVVRNLSTSFNDVFRTMQTLPGISTNNEVSAKFNVRGGNFDENLVLVNETQVYEPFHIKEATNASVGIFNVDLIRKVDLITGGFSAEYGDKMSSVLKIDYREGDNENFKGIAALSLTDYDLLLEGPITKSSNFIIGVRKSYVEYLMNLLKIDERINAGLYDVQGVLTYNINNRNKILFQFIHSGDTYSIDPKLDVSSYSYKGNVKGKTETFNLYESDFDKSEGDYYTTMLNLQWKSFLSNKSFLKTEALFYYQSDRERTLDTLYSLSTGISNTNYFYLYRRERRYENELIINTFEGKISFNHQITPYFELKSGLSITSLTYKQNILDFDKRNYYNNTDMYPDTINITLHASSGDEINDINNTKSYKFFSYLENLFQLNNFLFSLGCRFDYFDMNKELTFSPRLNLSYRIRESILRFAYGIFYQSPLYSQFKYSYQTRDNTKSQKAIHYIAGIDLPIYNNLNLKVEFFYKKYVSLISSRRTNWWRIIYSKENDADGYAKGFDAQINFSLSNLYGWISYGLLYTKEDILNDNKPEYPRYTDQRHTLSIVINCDFGKGWDGNIRGFYGSGYAYTPSEAFYNLNTKRWYWVEGPRNSAYLPYYLRFDIKIGKQFTIFNLSSETFLDVINAFNIKNIMSYRYTFNSNGTPKREEIKLFPIIPSLGLRIKF